MSDNKSSIDRCRLSLKRLIAVWTCLFLFIYSGFSPLQANSNNEIEWLKATVAELSARIASLESALQNKVVEEHAVSPSLSHASKIPPPLTTIEADRKGFRITSEDDRFTLGIRPRMQIDGKWFPDNDHGRNEFFIRRLRPVFEGSVDSFRWRFMPELAGDSRILDAWISWLPNDTSVLTAGKFKGLLGLERNQSFSDTLFIERSLPSAMTPVRETGLLWKQRWAAGKLTTNLAFVNGSLDDSDNSNNSNLNRDFDFTASVFTEPFRQDKEHLLHGLGLGFALSQGKENTLIDNGSRNHRIRYKSSGGTTFFKYCDGLKLDGTRRRLNPHCYFYNGPFGIMTEWVRSSYDVSATNPGSRSETLSNEAWMFQAGMVLTGEKATYKGVLPLHPFNPAQNQWGAFEAGLRFWSFHADSDAFDGWVAAGTCREVDTTACALKWYLTENLLWAINFEKTRFQAPDTSPTTEEVVLSRLQLNF